MRELLLTVSTLLLTPVAVLQNRVRTRRYRRLAAQASGARAEIVGDRLIVGGSELGLDTIRRAEAWAHIWLSMASGSDEELVITLDHAGGRLILCGDRLWTVHEALVARGLLPSEAGDGGTTGGLVPAVSGLLWAVLILVVGAVVLIIR